MHATSSTYWGVCDSNYLHHLVQWHTVQPGNTNTDTQCIHQHSNTQCMPHHQHIDAYETVTTCTTWYSDTQLNQATPTLTHNVYTNTLTHNVYTNTLTHNVYTNTLTHNACLIINILMRMRQLLPALPGTVTHSSTRQHQHSELSKSNTMYTPTF